MDTVIENLKELDKEIFTIKKYRERIESIKSGIPMVKYGKGIYTEPKRNAYKINKNGKYGNLTIDVPKLMGHLHLTATKGDQKVIDKKVDIDTIDLLTTRFKSNEKYSDLSKRAFDELNRLSDIPIHKSSKKYKKLGSGVIYYNNPEDLLSRLELLGGSILGGNNGVKDEFSQIYIH